MFHTLSFKNIFSLGVVMFWLISHSRLSDARHEKHFIYFKFTALTRTDTFPEFSAVCVYDKKQISHYSNEKKVWILTDKDWTEAPEEPPDSRNWFIHQIRTLSNCTDSQCSDHVLQRIIGCELEKLPNGSVTNLTVFDEYGFDGEDLISFNPDTMKWTENNPKAKETKMEWNRQTERNMYLKHYLKTCMNWISTFNSSKKSSPDVHLFASKSDDESKLNLICLATGFYPRDIQMNIRLNKTNLEDQTSSGIRPNNDETFQKRISVKIDRNHEGSYDCQITHRSLTEPVTIDWDVNCIDGETWIVKVRLAAAVLAALTGIVIVIGHCIYKRRRSNGQTAMTEENLMMTEKHNKNHPVHTQADENSGCRESSEGLNDPGLTDYCDITH